MTKAAAALTAASFFMAAVASATPEAAHWRREILLGVNTDSYFVWVSEWLQRGSNHTYEEAVSLERRLLADFSIVATHVVHGVSASDIDAPYDWKKTYAEHEAFDVSAYLRQNGVSPAFSGDWLCNASLRDGALVMSAGDSTVTVVSAEWVRVQIPEIGRDPRVAGCWRVAASRGQTEVDVWFYSVQSNSACWDDSWSELLIAVPGDLVRGAAAQLPE